MTETNPDQHPLYQEWKNMEPASRGFLNFSSWLARRPNVVTQGAPVIPEYSGASVDYYKLPITVTTSGGPAYVAECNDIIEALGMNYAEGNAFKAIWRRAAQRTLGKAKKGAKADGLYDAQKVEFFGKRLVAQSEQLKEKE